MLWRGNILHYLYVLTIIFLFNLRGRVISYLVNNNLDSLLNNEHKHAEKFVGVSRTQHRKRQRGNGSMLRAV